MNWISKNFILRVDFGEEVDLLEFLISLEAQCLLFLVSQIQKENSIEYLLSCFIVLVIVRFLKYKLLKQLKTELEHYPLAPTSTANRSTTF